MSEPEGSRAQWAKLLPVVQAFVDGKPIQVKDFHGRWADTEFLVAVLGHEWRVRPDNLVMGVWTVEALLTDDSPMTGACVLCMAGDDTQPPQWPRRSNLKYRMETQKFRPNAPEPST